jgi:hypothetical protein
MNMSFTGKIYNDLRQTNGPHKLSEHPHPLEKLSDNDLLRRFSELADSMWIFGPNLEVTRFLVPDLPIWKSGIVCAAEIDHRKLANEENFLLMDQIIGIGSKSIRSAMKGKLFPNPGIDVPVKFMEKRFLSNFVTKGDIYFSPATKFIDDSLSIAQRDDEMEFKSYINPTGVTISTMDKPDERIPIIESTNIETSVRMKTNYYLFSTTYGADPRHFIDFHTDACVFIKNQKEFIHRVIEAIKIQNINWECSPFFFKIGYFDKFEYSKQALPSMAKDIKYWYQFEERLVLLPPKGKPATEMNSFILSIGSIADITSTFEIG